MLTFDYTTDYGAVIGRYPARVGDESNLDFLPSELQVLYVEMPNNFNGCRTTNLTPRKVRLLMNTDTTIDIELPIRPTFLQLQSIKNNADAIIVQTIGEVVKYPKLRYRFGSP